MIREGVLRLGGGILGELLSAGAGYRGPLVACGNGHEARLSGYRRKVIDTVLGPVRLRRAWYHCARCKRGRQHGHGLAPRDAELGVAGQSMSPGLAAMAATAGAAVPFARAAGLLEDLAGVRLTVKRVERAAESGGAALAAASRGQARLIACRKLVPLPPQPLPDKLYAVIDGTGVPVTRKETEGRDGKGEDGRARTREVKMAVFFTQGKLDSGGYPVRDRASSSYIAAFEPAAVFGDLVKAEGIRRGAEHVRQMTVIGDGAAWIWGIATSKFPGATQIVDLYHAREHLHSLARSLEFMLLDRKDQWLAARLEDLDYGYIDGIAAAVRKYPLEGIKKDEVGKEARLLPQQRPPDALPLVPPVRPVRRLRRRRGRLQGRHRPETEAIRHALDRQRRRLDHRAALRRGQQPAGSHLPRPSQPDRCRLNSPHPKMIFTTYESVAHPRAGRRGCFVGGCWWDGGMPRRSEPRLPVVVYRTARVGLRLTRGQRRRLIGLLVSAGDVWACVLELNAWRRARGDVPLVSYQALCRELAAAGPGCFGELDSTGARSVLRRYSDAWFAAAARRKNGDSSARFPRRRRRMLPVRWYHGTFAVEGRRLRIPVARGCAPLQVRLDRDLPYPPGQVRSVTLLYDAGRLWADVTAEVPVTVYPPGAGPDPGRVAGVDLGIIHPYAVAGPDGQALLVSGRAIRAEHHLHLRDTKARRRAVARRAPRPGQRGSRRWRRHRRRQRIVEARHARLPGPARSRPRRDRLGGRPPDRHPRGRRSPRRPEPRCGAAAQPADP